MTTDEEALYLYDLGLSLYPVPLPGGAFDGKRAHYAWKGLQNERVTREEVAALFARPHTIAIVTGSRWGLAVVDADDDVAVDWMRRCLLASPWRWRSARGLKAAYSITEPTPTRSRIFGPGGIALDIQADGGSTIGPGSLHASGVRYVVEEDADWTVPVAALPPLPELLRRHLKARHPLPADGGHHHAHPRDPQARASAYLAACERPREGGRAPATFKVACKLVGMIGLAVEETVDMLAPWSGLPEREVRAQVMGAAKRNRELRR
jgi:hypothetical protein